MAYTGTNIPPGSGGNIPGLGSQTITPAQVAAVANLAGFRGDALTTAVAVSFAEDGSHDTRAVNHNADGSWDTGLWQINSVHWGQFPQRDLADAQKNAHAAYVISSGGHNWTPWTTYKNGEYRAQVGAANAAITQMRSQGGAAKVAQGIGHSESFPGTNEVGGAVSDVAGAVESIPHFLGMLADVGTWERVGYVIAGLLAMGFGAFAILKSLGVSAPPIPIPV